MQYILSIVVAILLACAQALWRVVAQREGVTTHNIFKVLFTLNFIAGALLYIVATIIYLYLQSKYLFTSVQSVLLISSLVVSFVIAWLYFAEKISPLNLVGLALLLVGIVLVVQK